MQKCWHFIGVTLSFTDKASISEGVGATREILQFRASSFTVQRSSISYAKYEFLL